MNVQSLAGLSPAQLPLTTSLPTGASSLERAEQSGGGELQQTFDAFVGETFYGQMLQAMRKTQGTPAYFHGGRAEEVFRNQLDQTLSQELAKNSAGQFTGGMFDLFNLQRRG